MKREVRYNGMTLRQMSMADLCAQYNRNKDRLIVRTSLLAVFSAAAILLVAPAAGIFPLAVCVVTGYWLWQNNEAIRKEILTRST